MIKKYSCERDGQVYINKHFQIYEFRSFDDAQGILTTDDILIDDNLVENLERLYESLNCSSIYITSGYRSEDFDIRLGGFVGYHSKGQASDIICYDIDGNVIDSKNVCITAENLGILGIGYGGSYTHIDTRDWKSFFDETNGAVNIESWYDYFGIARPVEPKPESKEEIKNNDVNVEYCVKTVKHGWLPVVRNLEDYAGFENSPIIGLAMKVDKGSIKYRVHSKKGYWMPFVIDFDINNYETGFAGDDSEIDAVEVYYFTPDNIRPFKRAKYKVNNYDWQFDNEKENGQDGYAGVYGVTATKFQIVIE